MASSSASLPFRCELRPSRWETGALSILALLAPFSVIVSGLPRAAAWPIAALAFVVGLLWTRRRARRPVRLLGIDAAGDARIDDRRVDDLEIAWRGPLAFLRWREMDGGQGTHVCWPDTLPPPLRRELRLAGEALAAVRRRDAMAP